MRPRRRRRGFYCAVHQCDGGCADAPPAESNDAVVALSRQFWEAILARNERALDDLVGFPFTWDARCRLFASRAEMDARLHQEHMPKSVRIGAVRAIARGDVSGHEAESLDKLMANGGCDASSVAALQAEAARQERRYVLVELLNETEAIPTVMRVSRPSANAPWRVTGLDN